MSKKLKGKSEFTLSQINEIKRLIALRNITESKKQKSVRDTMRKIGFYGKGDWGIIDCQPSDLEQLIKSGRIKITGHCNKDETPETFGLKPLAIRNIRPPQPDIMSQQTPETEIEKARLKYKPREVVVLLVAEAPPNAAERFFYYEDVKESDWLFLGVTEALYPILKKDYLNNRMPEKKACLLNKFKDDGFYLIDLSDVPKSPLNAPVETYVEELIEKVANVVSESTKIILIKANVYECAYLKLKQHGFNVMDIKIPFPSSGQQRNFQQKFRDALKMANNF